MAWHLENHVIRGEIDNRERGRITGRLWCLGLEQPIELHLSGNAWRDVAGNVLRFSNPSPTEGNLEGFITRQAGTVGDITASRRVRILDDVNGDTQGNSSPLPSHLANAMYLEWFSEANGRVVVEAAHYTLEIGTDFTWLMTQEEEVNQQADNIIALTKFIAERTIELAEYQEFEGEEESLSAAEIAADAAAARLELILDRVHRRMARENIPTEDFDIIWNEEQEKHRKELGEVQAPPMTPEEAAAHQTWIEELNSVGSHALEELENGDLSEPEEHPLVRQCQKLYTRLRLEADASGWVNDAQSQEHPLQQILNGIVYAGPKLAGALWLQTEGWDWPPGALMAGDTLVRLKKAREFLRDAVAALNTAETDQLATAEWRGFARAEIKTILIEVQTLIREVRSVMK